MSPPRASSDPPEVPEETRRLMDWMGERWQQAGSGRRAIAWEAAGPARGASRQDMLRWWLGEPGTRGVDPPVTYSHRELATAWAWFLRERPNRGVQTFLRESNLPGYVESATAGQRQAGVYPDGQPVEPEEDQQRATQAWGEVLGLVTRLGRYSSNRRYHADDAEHTRRQHAIQRLGGWAALCAADDFERRQHRRAFTDVYTSYQPPAPALRLVGTTEEDQ